MDPNTQNQINENTSQTSQEQINVKDSLRSTIAKNQTRDSSGKFVSKGDPLKVPPISITTNTDQRVSTTNPPDLVNVKITNPNCFFPCFWLRWGSFTSCLPRIKD